MQGFPNSLYESKITLICYSMLRIKCNQSFCYVFRINYSMQGIHPGVGRFEF